VKKIVCLVMTCMVMIGSLCINAAALDENAITFFESEAVSSADVLLRASNSFTMEVTANGRSKANKTFSLEAGETVEISAVYSPKSASVDFGLIDPDGAFHYFNVKDGSIEKTIQVNEPGNYTFAVRNNSQNRVLISGFINY